MNFTRDPIIETVITPKEGFKLLVRPSVSGAGEEYQVDAVEVVSFARATFLRSLEKPKAFMLPANDYEIVEIKETRVVLKKASIEKPIKIAGGKRTPPPQKAAPEKEQPEKEQPESKDTDDKDDEPKKGRKRKKVKAKRTVPEKKEEKPVKEEKTPEQAPPQRKMRAIIPPPSALISESIGKYKDIIDSNPEASLEDQDDDIPPPPVDPKSPPKKQPKEPEDQSLEEYHPQDDEVIDNDLLPEQDIDDDDPLNKSHNEEE